METGFLSDCAAGNEQWKIWQHDRVALVKEAAWSLATDGDTLGVPLMGVPAEGKTTDWEQGQLLNASAICTWSSIPVLAALLWTAMGSTTRPQLPPAQAVRQMATWPRLEFNQIILSIVFAVFCFLNRHHAKHKERNWWFFTGKWLIPSFQSSEV